MQTSQQLKEKVQSLKAEGTKRHSPMKVAMFMKSPREKELLKTLKKEVNGKLIEMFGKKRVGNAQFAYTVNDIKKSHGR